MLFGCTDLVLDNVSGVVTRYFIDYFGKVYLKLKTISNTQITGLLNCQGVGLSER